MTFGLEQRHAADQGNTYPYCEPLKTRDFDIYHDELPLTQFPSLVVNQCYSLKLALLRKPNDLDLHDYIIGNMDFDNLSEPLLKYEILCFLAEFKGMAHPATQKLFEQSVWLMGQTAAAE